LRVLIDLLADSGLNRGAAAANGRPPRR
jgi:hypothetical protein